MQEKAPDLGVDLLVPAESVAAVRDLLLAAGAEPIGAEAAEIARVEAGRPRVGFEIGPQTMPQEAGINERAVSFTKGCYIGQETVARLHYKGKPNRSLRGLRLSAPVAAGDPIRLGERELGQVGTAVLSPARGPIALAIVRREAEPGATVAVGDGVDAEVVDLRSLRPLDVETVAASVARTNRALCVEEGWPSYGVTAEIAARISKACFDDLDAPVERVGMAEVPLPYAKNLELAAMPGAERIAAAARSVLNR